MNDLTKISKRYETVAWGVGLIFFGILNLIPGEQVTIALLGLAVILLGLNLARYLNRVPMSYFSITLGVLALIAGAWLMFRPATGFGIELDLFAILLIILGLYLLIPSPKKIKTA